MKIKKIIRKLEINKSTISDLTASNLVKDELKHVYGGSGNHLTYCAVPGCRNLFNDN